MESLSFRMSTSSLLDEAKGHGGLFQCSLIITEFFLYNQTEPKVFSYVFIITITLTKILSIYDTPQISISVFCSCELFQMG